ncbi:MAG: hypothetical protein ABSG89_04240 [Bacteroidales bacterium]|jgi:hypothetical protein
MQEISSALALQDAIQLLESEQEVKKQLLKEQFFITYESLKPLNLLKSAISDLTSSPYITDDLSGSAIGLATGYLTKKIFVGTSGNLVRKLIGSILQFGVANIVAQHSETIKSIGQTIFHHFLHNKK